MQDMTVSLPWLLIVVGAPMYHIYSAPEADRGGHVHQGRGMVRLRGFGGRGVEQGSDQDAAEPGAIHWRQQGRLLRDGVWHGEVMWGLGVCVYICVGS